MVAIIDYGMGNLFSVKQACAKVGLVANITDSPEEILKAEGVILPGVGAFGDAMSRLHKKDLVGVLKDVSGSDKPFLGICLGLQLLFSESAEFGNYKGLGIIDGKVVKFSSQSEKNKVRVPHIGWNRISSEAPKEWIGTPLEGLKNGEYLYFVHSYYASLTDSKTVLAVTEYGGQKFCSGLKKGNTFGFQFHPERSGHSGLKIYENFSSLIKGINS